MASMQCCRPAEQSSQHKHGDNSFGHKVTETIKGVFKGHQHGHPTHNHTQTHIPEDKAFMPGHQTTHGFKSKTKKTGEHKHKDTNLLQRMKDGISGNSSDSSSDSDDDNSHHKRKN